MGNGDKRKIYIEFQFKFKKTKHLLFRISYKNQNTKKNASKKTEDKRQYKCISFIPQVAR